MHSHVQRVLGSPIQNGNNAEIQFYVQYPGGGTMSQDILILIITEKLDSIQTNSGFELKLLTVTELATPATPTMDNLKNAVSVVLNNFQSDQVRNS